METITQRFLHNIQQLVLLVAIALLFPMVVYYGIILFLPKVHLPRPEKIDQLIYQEVKIDEQITDLKATKQLTDKEKTVLLKVVTDNKTLKWSATQETKLDKESESKIKKIDEAIAALQEKQKLIYEEHEKEQKAYNEKYQELLRQRAFKVFMISLLVSIPAIIIGFIIKGISIGSGFVIGGLFSLSFGYAQYWYYMEDLIKFITILITLIIIIVIGFYYLRARK